MTVMAGDEIRAGNFPVIDSADQSADITLSTTAADVTGATLTVVTTSTTAQIHINGTFYFNGNTVSGTTLCQGLCLIDGVEQGGTAVGCPTVNGERETKSRTWTADLTAGTHTVKLQAKKSAAAGTYQCLAGQTTISIIVGNPNGS